MRRRPVSPERLAGAGVRHVRRAGQRHVHLAADDAALLGVLVDGDAVAAEGGLDVELAAQQGDDLVLAEAVARDADAGDRPSRRDR